MSRLDGGPPKGSRGSTTDLVLPPENRRWISAARTFRSDNVDRIPCDSTHRLKVLLRVWQNQELTTRAIRK